MRSQLFIRKATRDDIPAIVELNGLLAGLHTGWDDYYKSGDQTAAGFRSFLQEVMGKRDVLILVLQTDEALAGYFLGMIDRAKPFVKPDKVGRISDAFIREAYRQSGWGRRMFEEMLDWFREKGVEYLELSVDARNRQGIEAWQSFGMEPFMIKMKRKIQ